MPARSREDRNAAAQAIRELGVIVDEINPCDLCYHKGVYCIKSIHDNKCDGCRQTNESCFPVYSKVRRPSQLRPFFSNVDENETINTLQSQSKDQLVLLVQTLRQRLLSSDRALRDRDEDINALIDHLPASVHRVYGSDPNVPVYENMFPDQPVQFDHSDLFSD